MLKSRLEELFKNKKWAEIAHSFEVEEMISILNFDDNLRLAYRFLSNDAGDDELREKSTLLLFSVRSHYPIEWSKSWRNSAFLGEACRLVFKYDEEYEAYKAAYDQANPPPPELMTALARCASLPGTPPVPVDEAIALLKESLKMQPYIDTAQLLAKYYWEEKNEEEEKYWKAQLAEMKRQGIRRVPPLVPLFLVEESLEDKRKANAPIKERVTELFKQEQWKQIATTFEIGDIGRSLTFEDNLRLAYHLLYNSGQDEELQEKARRVLFFVKYRYSVEWNKSWRNEAFLGKAYQATLEYDKRYAAYSIAYEQANPPPPELMIALARCAVDSYWPSITLDEGIDLLKRSLEVHPYTDAVKSLIDCYWEKEDPKEEKYWKEQLVKMQREGIKQSPPLEPSFLIKSE